MPERSLKGCRILVVEDEYLLADDLDIELADAGAIVIGPVGRMDHALALIDRHELDGATLDVNLRGEMAFPVADLLIERRIPLIFATGYDSTVIPKRFEHVIRCEKPINLKEVARAMGKVIHAADAG